MQKLILLRIAVCCAPYLAMLSLFLPMPVTAAGVVTSGADPESGLKYWEWQADGVLFRLTQRLPDQTRAFFLARGFEAEDAEKIALSCVFQSMFKNTAKETGDVELDMQKWRVFFGEKTFSPLTREIWSDEWKKRQVSKSARIAFEWSLLPTRQIYSKGDYNWGMSSYGLSPGSQFSLEFSWKRNDKFGTGRIDNIECPPDIHPEPQ